MNIPICVTVVVWDDRGHIAASARRHDHDSWGLPGGKLEPQDGDVKIDLKGTLLRAAVRELLEETGLVVDPDNLNPCYTGICKDESGGGNPDSITVTYQTSTYTGTIETREGEPPAAWQEWSVLLRDGSFKTYNQAVFDTCMSE